MTHCYIWRIADFMGIYISRILSFLCNIYKMCSEFLCKMLYMCSVFYMIFVQFLGVCKCLNNPFCAICRIANTKKPHRANFKVTDSYLESGYLSKKYILRRGTSRTSPYAISSKDSTSPSWTCAFASNMTHLPIGLIIVISSYPQPPNPKPFARFKTSQPYTDNVYP